MPDYARAQEMIRSAMKEAAKECGFKDAVDFGVVVSACQAAVLAEIAPSDMLMKPGGIDHVADVFIGQFRDFMTSALIDRAKHERRKARH